MKFLTYLALFLTISITGNVFPLRGQEKVPSDRIAFQQGEKLVYAVSYKIGFVNTDIAEVIFSTSGGAVNGRPTYHVTAIGQTYPFYSWFFEMRDVYDTWLDVETLKPLYFKNNIREGNYRFVSSMVYDWDNMRVKTKAKNLRIGQERSKEMELSPTSYDGVALYYNLRNTDLQTITDGFRGNIELVLADTIKRLQYRFLGREVKSVPGLGKFNTLKFACQLTNSKDDNAFKEGTEFTAWFSDDRNKIPLYIESPIRVGSIKGRLLEWNGLKYPLSSPIEK